MKPLQSQTILFPKFKIVLTPEIKFNVSACSLGHETSPCTHLILLHRWTLHKSSYMKKKTVLSGDWSLWLCYYIDWKNMRIEITLFKLFVIFFLEFFYESGCLFPRWTEDRLGAYLNFRVCIKLTLHEVFITKHWISRSFKVFSKICLC